MLTGFTDIHTHILPAMDDGARDMEESLAMLEQAAGSGTRHIVASPHVIWREHQPDWQDICAGCAALNDAAAARNMEIMVHSGAEVALVPELLEDAGALDYCINCGPYMLLELPMLQMPRYAESVFFGLQTKGISPVLAHPERYPDVVGDPEMLLEWLRRGVLLQVNAKSLTGMFGPEVQRCAELLVANRVVTAIASDAHTPRGRNTRMDTAYAQVAGKYGEARANELFIENPAAMICGRQLKIAQVPDWLEPPDKNPLRRFFKRIFG